MLEKPFYFGLYKEGFVLKDGNPKDSPDYKKFSDIIQKIDKKQRLLYLEWDGTSIFLGVQFHCSSVSTKDSRPVRDSRRMYFEQIPFGKDDSPNLPRILQQFYQRADEKIKSFYSERYDKIQMRLATSGNFNDFISGYIPKQVNSSDNETSKFFGGKILFNEQCTVLSSDFIRSVKMITDLFEVIKYDKKKIVIIISELDNPNDTKPDWDFLVRVPIQDSDKNQNIKSFTYNADTQTFSESTFTQSIYKLLYNYFATNRSVIQKIQDSDTVINNFVQSCTSSKDSAKLPIGELCKSKLGKIIAKELIVKKLNNNEKVDSDIIKLVYSSQTAVEQDDFGKILIDNDYDFPELYTNIIKKILFESDQKKSSYFISKDFPEYRIFQTNLASTFNKLPWDDQRFSSNAKKTLELIFSKYSVDKVGEGGKIFIQLLYQTLYDHQEIDKEFVRNYSQKMKAFDIKIPQIADKSLLNNSKLRWSVIGYVAFGAGFLFALIFLWLSTVLSGLLQQLNGFINSTITIWIIPIPVWILILGVVIVILLLGYYLYRKGFWQKIVR